MVKELERADELRKGDLLPNDTQVMIDSITRLLHQADARKLSNIYNFVVHII